MTAYARWCVSIVTTLLVLLVVEAAANVYYFVRRPRVDASGYCGSPALEPSDRSWCPQYAADIARYDWHQRYESYTVHRIAPYASATINVDARGLRATPGSDPTENATRVFLFGGSTMLGVGVPDDKTIPALLLARLRRAHPERRFHVRNYGSSWWVSTQSLVRLLLELRNGERPDVVIFYDGINDVDSVTQDEGAAPRAGNVWPGLRHALEQTVDPPERPYGAALVDLLNGSRAVSLARLFVARRLGYPRPPTPDERAIRAAAPTIVDAYRRTIDAAGALAREHAFTFYAFWQPSPLVSASPMPCAADLVPDRRDRVPYEMDVYRDTYSRVKQLCGSGWCVYLGELFDREIPRCPYTDDEGHLAPWGNALVADQIAARLAAR